MSALLPVRLFQQPDRLKGSSSLAFVVVLGWEETDRAEGRVTSRAVHPSSGRATATRSLLPYSSFAPCLIRKLGFGAEIRGNSRSNRIYRLAHSSLCDPPRDPARTQTEGRGALSEALHRLPIFSIKTPASGWNSPARLRGFVCVCVCVALSSHLGVFYKHLRITASPNCVLHVFA